MVSENSLPWSFPIYLAVCLPDQNTKGPVQRSSCFNQTMQNMSILSGKTDNALTNEDFENVLYCLLKICFIVVVFSLFFFFLFLFFFFSFFLFF